MILKFEAIEENLIVYLQGELDHHSAQEVRNRVDDEIEKENYQKLIFDFTGVTFMDSSGIGVIIGRYKKMALKNGIVCITNVRPVIERIFELSGMYKIISVYKDIKDALTCI